MYRTEGHNENITLEDLKNKSIKVGKIKHQKSNSFLLVGSSSPEWFISNPFFTLLHKLRSEKEKYEIKIDAFLSKLQDENSELINKQKQNLERPLINVESIKKPKEKQTEIDTDLFLNENEVKELANMIESANQSIKQRDVIIEFTGKV